MPPLIGMNVDDATKLLDDMDLGLLVILDNVVSEDYEQGIVMNSDPVDGVKLEQGQTVTLYVSTGPEEEEAPMQVPVPQLVGLQLNTAISELQAVGLDVGSINNEVSDEEEGTVIDQSVLYGTNVDEGTKIDLVVSLGPEEEEPPEVEEPEENPNTPEDPGTTEDPDTPEDPGATEDPGTTEDPDTPTNTESTAKLAVPLPTEGSVHLVIRVDGSLVIDEPN